MVVRLSGTRFQHHLQAHSVSGECGSAMLYAGLVVWDIDGAEFGASQSRPCHLSGLYKQKISL